MAISSQH